jgi:TetR/AcrR family tetracycline transcriptional repressor
MPLERESVVRVALALLDEVGLDGLTVRRLAERLGVQNPALYRHFKNKQDLLDAMARAMIADAFRGIGPPATGEYWALWLEEVATRFQRTVLAHRDGARVLGLADLSKSDVPATQEMALRVLTAAGFDLRTALVSVVALFDYALGAAFEEQADPTHSTRRRYDTSRTSPFDSARLPLLTTALTEIAATPAGAPSLGFKGGLDLILAGMAAKKASQDR